MAIDFDLSDPLERAAARLHAGQPQAAAELYTRVLQAEPRATSKDALRAHLGRAASRLQMRQPEAALADYEQALSLKPDEPGIEFQRIALLLDLRRGAAALDAVDRLLRRHPAEAPMHFLRGKALALLDRPDEALVAFERALSIGPEVPAALAECGRMLLRLGRAQPALSAYSKALALDPRNVDAHNGRGAVLRALRQYPAALESFATVLRLSPEHAGAANNYGLTLNDLGRSAEAAAHLRSMIARHPHHLPSLHNLAMILDGMGTRDEAAEIYGRLWQRAPEYPYAAGNLLRSRLSCCDWSDFEPQVERVLAGIAAGTPAADPLTALIISASPEVQLKCARSFAAREYPTLPPLWQGGRYQHDRIRVAYLSPDFHDHPVAQLLAGVLEHHDRRQFQTFGFSLRRDPDPGAMHLRMRGAFEHFYDVAEASDHEVAARLRQLEVDIAIDLGGFTFGGRLGILAHRPAPVQANYLGFAGTYGAPYIDYLIADRQIIPAGEEAHYSENIVRLPNSFLPHDDSLSRPTQLPTRSGCALPESGFVFCAFNNPYKIHPRMFDVWMRLLRDTPGSVLWLRTGPPALVANLSREAAARGVRPERLIFAPRLAGIDRHLARYARADLFLDTSPYGAHATAHDALWMGVPVVTLAGRSLASRVGASLLAALGVPELVTSDHEAYFQLARRLALEPPSLATIRKRLASHAIERRAFDTDLFRRHLEAALRTMWERSQAGQGPGAIAAYSE